jgi:hypothetical protein
MGRRIYRMNKPVYALLPALLLLLSAGAIAVTPGASHYLPVAGDNFAYSENIVLNDGTGNYSGYSESSNYNGNLDMTAIASNGTVSATYQESGTWSNNQGQSYPWSEEGSFMFSSVTYLYVHGTDNQTGYNNPYVWFYMNNTLTKGQTFESLNTEMTVVSIDYPYSTSLTSTGYASTIFAEGNGSYQRNDAYGNFAATYNWKEYFDPNTGYLVGYLYTEQDTDGSGDGFTWIDAIADTSTTFHLTAVTGPATTLTSVTISPIDISLVAGSQQIYTAVLTCNPSCPASGITYEWSVTSSSLGSISGGGTSVTFTAGSSAATGGIYVNATLASNTVGASTIITVTAQSNSGPGPSSNSWIVPLVVVLVFLFIIIIIIAIVASRRRSRAPAIDRNIPRHSYAQMPTTAPTYSSPAPVKLIPSDQPSVQQIVIRETVKVPCTYCGTLIDSTDTVCPKCGAPRT